MPSGEFEFEDEYEYDFWNVPPPSLRVSPWLRYFVAMRLRRKAIPDVEPVGTSSRNIRCTGGHAWLVQDEASTESSANSRRKILRRIR
jgi:hypothetical protein